MTPAENGLRPSLWASALTLFTSSATLICCALPALLVALGLSAVLAGWVSAVPGLIWLSAQKLWVFGGAGLMLALAGALQWRARSLPCPADPRAAATCQRLRRGSLGVYWASVAIYATGALFAFGLPWWMG